MTLKHRLSCVILAGGKNTRMGSMKALLQMGDRTILERQVDRLNQIFEEIIVATNSEESFNNIRAKVITDIIPDAGPMGGLYSGLSVSSNVHSFLIACDMPFMDLNLIDYMIRQIGENDIVIPISRKGLEALFAVYSINCLETIRESLESRSFKLLDLLRFHKVRYITEEEIKKFDSEELSFFNVNSPRDYKKALSLWNKW